MEYKHLTELGMFAYMFLTKAKEYAKQIEAEMDHFLPSRPEKNAESQPVKRGRGRPRKEGRIEIKTSPIPGRMVYAIGCYAKDNHKNIQYLDQLAKVKASDLIKYKGVGWSAIVKTSRFLQEHGLAFADAPKA